MARRQKLGSWEVTYKVGAGGVSDDVKGIMLTIVWKPKTSVEDRDFSFCSSHLYITVPFTATICGVVPS